MKSISHPANNGSTFLCLCLQCGEGFSPRKSSHHYCSAKCRNRAKAIRVKISGRSYPRIGKEYAHRFLYRAVFGSAALPDDYDCHHILGYANVPFNLLALPHSVHAKMHHMLRKDEDVSELLAPYFVLRDKHFRKQSMLLTKSRRHSPDRHISTNRISQKRKKEGLS